MDQVAQIFNSLGADKTVFYQFGIFLIAFVLLKIVFFDKLQFVLELRESKTTKLEGDANKKFQEAEKLAGKYKEEMERANTEAQKIFNQRKIEVLNEQASRVKQVEDKINSELENKKAAFREELDAKKSGIMTTADSLASELVNKLSS